MTLEARSRAARGMRVADAYPAFAADAVARFRAEAAEIRQDGDADGYDAERAAALYDLVAEQIPNVVIGRWCSCSETCPSFNAKGRNGRRDKRADKVRRTASVYHPHGWLAVDVIDGAIVTFDVGLDITDPTSSPA